MDLSTEQVAKKLKYSVRTVRYLIERGVFPNAYKIDPNSKSVYRIPAGDIENYVKLRGLLRKKVGTA